MIKKGDRVAIATKATGTPTVIVGKVIDVLPNECKVGNIENWRTFGWSNQNKNSKSSDTKIVADYAILPIGNSTTIEYPTSKNEDNLRFTKWEYVLLKDTPLVGKEVIVNIGTGQKRNELARGVVEKETDLNTTTCIGSICWWIY